ncbi:hypothetical protein ONR75_15895 [Rhodopseudomonas sp. P2A-2r]|uniref:hypothetical protein n=1 Tax=Rhodopseudomonas sp. P2A-2r TaxID=2991972 RepID=UPI002233E813|nr:hypothetical protein [Rhodopseudomonas sp. P2A-2r]UZE51913.1 hypothetical protein ONR75_15895 [Rhodopseudomonas sp. P2A-2r]
MSPSAELICIELARVAEFWPHVRGMILGAIERTGLSDAGDVEGSILRGGSLLWIAWNGKTIEAAASTEIMSIGARKVCVLVACGGRDRRRWLPMLRKLEIYAKAEGCSCVRIIGRRGWVRVLKSYAVKHVILERPL